MLAGSLLLRACRQISCSRAGLHCHLSCAQLQSSSMEASAASKGALFLRCSVPIGGKVHRAATAEKEEKKKAAPVKKGKQVGASGHCFNWLFCQVRR